MFALAAVCVATILHGDPAPARDTTLSAPAAIGADTIRKSRSYSTRDTLSPPDSLRAKVGASVLTPVACIPTVLAPTTLVAAAFADPAPVKRQKRVVIEYSDWYGRRLTIHRWASVATLPLFVGNYLTGTQLLENGNQAPAWAIRAHGPLATSVTSLFAVNTLTGGWNLLAGAQDPSGRGWRVAHSLLMLTADAGFATAGILASQAERSDAKRQLHRTVALSSVGIAALSYVMMIPPFRRD